VPLLGDLADAVGLSESRLTRLFNASLGLSVRRYVQWLRLRHVVFCMAGGDNITTAAHEAGFADLAHLSRTFRSMFGLPISSFFGATTHVDWQIQLPPGPAPGPHAAQDGERWAALARTLAPESAAPVSVARRRRPRGGSPTCGLRA
jgi:AraC-like DNA-binding protein